MRALYVVNQQRYLAPEKRVDPPFTMHQLEDARIDDRGLVTTWQLFQLFWDIENGILTKDLARRALLEPGLVSFKPVTKCRLGTPKEIFQAGSIAIVDIAGVKIKTGQTLLAEKNGRYRKVTILSLKLNDLAVHEVENGEAGILLDDRVDLSTSLWSTE